MKLFNTVKFRIFLLTTFFFTLLIIANMFYSVYESKKQFNSYLENLNRSSAKLLDQNTKSFLYNLDYTKIKQTIDYFNNPYFKRIYILNKDGYIFAQRDKEEIIFKKYKDFNKLLNTENKNIFLYFAPIKITNKILGYLIIENDEKILEEIITAEKNKILIVSFILFIVTIFFSYIISIIITRPINNIINSLKNLDENTTLKLNYNKKDEFGYLSKIIEQNHNKIQDLNTNLEKKIKDEVDKNLHKEKQLYEAQKMASMGEMIGNIAHQWRQPLSVISTGATGVIMRKEYDMLSDEDLIESCNIINTNAQYLSKTIDDFRDFIKGSNTKSIFELNKEIESFLHLVHGSIKNNHINIVLDLKKDIKINGYANELIQCLINIFNNAQDVLSEIKNEDDRIIFISSILEKDKVVIKIKDSGGGIPEAILFKIFEPYFTTKHQAKGTGLGLHMTYNLIVDSMAGTIKATNSNYKYNGKEYTGALFTIVLPLS